MIGVANPRLYPLPTFFGEKNLFMIFAYLSGGMVKARVPKIFDEKLIKRIYL